MTPTVNPLVDPIVIADVVLEAALAADAEVVRIEAGAGHHTIAVTRGGEILASSMIDSTIALHVIARLGYVCNVDPSDRRATTGRTRVRTHDAQRDIIFTLRPGHGAELLIVATGGETLADVVIGDRIGHYRVTAPLGAGGMGSVYEVVHEKLGRKHALKVLQNWVRERDRESIERFLQEAQAAARIRNHHIVEVFDFGYLADGRPYFVMELLGGKSLAHELESGALSESRAVTFGVQLARALSAAHERDVIHADVSPLNVIITKDHLTLIDFGLAQLAAAPDQRSEQVSGTPSYLAPERIAGFAATESSDQYAFGALMFELVTGRPPFTGGTPHEICLGHLNEPVPAIANPHGSVSPQLAAIITRCLAKHANVRYPSMHAVLAELLAIEEVLS